MSETPERDREDESDASDDAADAEPREELEARPATAGGGGGGAGVKVLGVERYVQFGYIALAGILFWLLDKVILLIWDVWAEPPTNVVTALAFATGVGTAIALYLQPKMRTLANEVGIELSKVTWPTRKETYAATIVVLVTSVIAAVYLGVLDFFWSAITDLIYQTKA